jgi:hypothetical protein
MPTLNTENRAQLLKYGATGRQTYESVLKGEKDARDAEKAMVEIAAARMKQARDFLPSVDTPEKYAAWRTQTLENLPGLVNMIPEQYSPEVVQGLMLEAREALEKHHVTRNLGTTTDVVAMPKYGNGPASVVAGSSAPIAQQPMNDYQKKQLGLEQARLALTRRGQDMIDARAREVNAASKAPAGFRYKANGDLERIPGGPADLKEQREAELRASGGSDVDIAISSLRDAYDRLEKGGGITSTKQSALSNTGAYIGSSGFGQGVGKMLGTQNQSARNDIAMTRPVLLAALMKATGMSAKQMDSNAELKLWLSTATDPTLDVQSNRKALANIERKYLRQGVQKPGASGGWDAPSAPADGKRPKNKLNPSASGGWGKAEVVKK